MSLENLQHSITKLETNKVNKKTGPLWALTLRAFALVALLCLVQMLPGAFAADTSPEDRLSKDLVALREKISKQADAVRSKRRALDEMERQAAIQSSQLEMQIAKVEARVKVLQSEWRTKKGSQQSSSTEDAARIEALKEDIALLRATLNRLAPIRSDERQAAVTQLEQSLAAADPQPLRGYNELISLISAEQELAAAIGAHRQTLILDGQPTPVSLFHVGHASVVFKSIDGRVGFVTLGDGPEPTIHLLDDGPARAEIERVVMKAQQGVPVHQAVLPLVHLATGAKAPRSESQLGQDSERSKNKL